MTQESSSLRSTFAVKNNPVAWLFSISIGIILLVRLINLCFFHYYIGSYHQGCSTFFYLLLTANIALLGVAKFIEEDIPRTALILGSVCQMFLVFGVMSFMWPALISTPFPLQDTFFFNLDLHMHYNIGSIYLWSKQHNLVDMSMSLWRSMDCALLLAPILLAIFAGKQSVRIYFSMLLISFIVGGVAYYFLPTTDPANAVHSIHFPSLQYTVIERFHAIHQHAIYTDYRTGGIASFPSFHNVWAATFIYCFRKSRKPLFFMVLTYSLLIILSTMLTGWHFLSDIIAGILLAALSAFLAEKLCSNPTTKAVHKQSQPCLYYPFNILEKARSAS